MGVEVPHARLDFSCQAIFDHLFQVGVKKGATRIVPSAPAKKLNINIARTATVVFAQTHVGIQIPFATKMGRKP